MLSVSRTLPRASRSSICASCLRQLHTTSRTPLRRDLSSPSPRRLALRSPQSPISTPLQARSSPLKSQRRAYAETSTADELIEEIQEQYATARDEFEIATEETEKMSVYAEEDRKAAREELDGLKKMYEEALGGANGEEVKRRVGQRIRELDQAVQALEEKALEH